MRARMSGARGNDCGRNQRTGQSRQRAVQPHALNGGKGSVSGEMCQAAAHLNVQICRLEWRETPAAQIRQHRSNLHVQTRSDCGREMPAVDPKLPRILLEHEMCEGYVPGYQERGRPHRRQTCSMNWTRKECSSRSVSRSLSMVATLCRYSVPTAACRSPPGSDACAKCASCLFDARPLRTELHTDDRQATLHRADDSGQTSFESWRARAEQSAKKRGIVPGWHCERKIRGATPAERRRGGDGGIPAPRG